MREAHVHVGFSIATFTPKGIVAPEIEKLDTWKRWDNINYTILERLFYLFGGYKKNIFHPDTERKRRLQVSLDQFW